jgi:riboflavin synthase
MYSGITRGVFPVVALERREGAIHFEVELPPHLLRDVEIGASIAIDGVCLTVVSFDASRAAFDAIQETLDLTTLGALHVGRLVSVERSVKVGDELGGHDVFGHVRCTGEVVDVRTVGAQLDLTLAVPPALIKYVSPKGFIALDGCSLTVGDHVDPGGRFSVHLIPETQRVTNFPHRKVGDRINVELDARTVAIVDTVERVIAERYADSALKR